MILFWGQDKWIIDFLGILVHINEYKMTYLAAAIPIELVMLIKAKNRIIAAL